MKLWNLPGAFNHRDLMQPVIDKVRNFDNDRVYKVHDTITGSVWNGGRLDLGSNVTACTSAVLEDTLESHIKTYNDMGVGVFFTFSNHLLTTSHLSDELGNTVLDILNTNKMNGIICSSDVLLRKVRNEAPNVQVHMSVIPMLIHRFDMSTDAVVIEYVKRQLDKYDSVCLSPNLNNRAELLFKLPDKHRLELMVSLQCNHGCPHSEEHYDLTAKANLYGLSNRQWVLKDSHGCMSFSSGRSSEVSNVIHPHETGKFCDMGFNKFKIHGRIDPYWVVTDRVNQYLLHPNSCFVDLHYRQMEPIIYWG